MNLLDLIDLPEKKVSLKALAVDRRRKTKHSEMERIIALPQVWEVPEALDAMNARFRRPGTTWRLRKVQAELLHRAFVMQGALGFIDVGHGKTLISWLLPAILEVDNAVILAPSTTLKQYRAEIHKYRQHFKGPADHQFTLMSYGVLSKPSGTAVLDKLKPQLIIADEVHKLKNPSAARTKRFCRFMEAHPECYLVGMSGTMMTTSILDMAHISKYALRHNSPVPVVQSHLDVWSRCFDRDGRPSRGDWDYMNRLMGAMGLSLKGTWGKERIRVARQGLFRRIRSSAGCVVTTSSSVGVDLEVTKIEEPTTPPAVLEFMAEVASTGEIPSEEEGEIIADDATLARIQKNLSCGFYYRWAWEEIGGKDDDWLMRRRQWGRNLRKELQSNADTGYDSPLLVSNRLARDIEKDPGLVDNSMLHYAWEEWKEVKHKPAPPTHAVWISDFFTNHVIKLMKSVDRPTIFWYSSRAIGEWAASTGYPVYGQGTEIPQDHAHTCFASIGVHGTGKNLQAWSDSIILEPPSSSTTWQQLIGRTHRAGQLSDIVRVGVYQHTEAFQKSFNTAYEGATFARDAQGVPQKLIEGLKEK